MPSFPGKWRGSRGRLGRRRRLGSRLRIWSIIEQGQGGGRVIFLGFLWFGIYGLVFFYVERVIEWNYMGLNRSCDFFQFFSVKQCCLDQILRIEFNFLNIEPIKVNFAILNSPLHCWLLNTFCIRTDKFPKWFLILVLEYFECLRKCQKIICFFCTLCNFYSDCIFNFL